MAGENTNQSSSPPIAPPEAPQIVSSVKLPILKKVQMTKDEAGNEVDVPPVTAQQILARRRERKAKSTLFMAIPDEHLARFHGIKDAKTLWAAIKTRFDEGLDKGYDRFQRLLNLLEIHGVGVSTEDANQKFLRSLPSAWSNISLIMRNKLGIDNLDIDDIPQLDNKDLDQIDQDDLEKMNLNWQVAMLSMWVKRFYKKTGRKLEFNGKEPVAFDKTKVECFNCHRIGHFSRDCRTARNPRNKGRDVGNVGYRGRDNGKRPAREEDEKALVVQDGLSTYDWSYQLEEEATDFALMAFTSNPSSSSSSNSEFNEKEVLKVKEEEVTVTVFDNRSSDEENSLANDRFKKGEGFHAVPPGNYMPPKPDISFAGLDESIYKFKISETVTSLSKDIKDASKISTAFVEKPKELVSLLNPVKYVKHVKPVKPVKTAKQTKKSKNFSSSPKVDRKKLEWENDKKMGIDFGFTMKACFVCGSMSHLIKDYTFHEDRMARKSVLPNNAGKGTGHKESRPVWNNVRRINHQNKFSQTTVFIRSGRIPVSATKPKAAASTSAAKPVNTGHPHQALKNKGIVDSGCSRRMTRNKAYLSNYQQINDGGFVAFGSSREGKAAQSHLLVVTDDFSRFSWVFFFATKDETSKVLKPFITVIKNQINKKVKVIRCDNGTKFKNRDLDEFCGMKGIKREYSNARTSQQNKVAERKYRTLIKAARTMLADSLLPIVFWDKAVNTACYVLNRALVTKHHNKTPYELLNDRSPRLDFMRPFGCLVTILNTLDPLGKFKGKADEGFLVGYSVTISAGNQTDKNACPQDINGNACTQDTVDTRKEVFDQHYIVMPLWSSISSTYKSSDDKAGDDKPKDDIGSKTVAKPEFEQGYMDQRGAAKADSTNNFNTISNPVNAASTSGTFNACGPSSPHPDAFIPDDMLLHMEPKKVAQALDNECWVEAIQDELLQFSLQKVWRLVDLPYRKKAIGTKWVYKNKKDERGIVVRNKARIFLAFTSFTRFIVYQMDVKSAFLYGTIEEEVYVSQTPGFIDPQFPHKVYMVEKLSMVYTSSQSLMSSIGELTFFLGLQVKQSEEGIFISQDKFQVTPNLSHLHAVKRIFRYLKGQPKLGLWYPRDSLFNLEAYSDSDYAKEYVATANYCGQVLWI
uniref:Retrovirus-related Pol polyprotein from transposon TNT 1-94 n=1 Tax=Tanacetum cinerariifolium TaxID=118510 RepID=A0A699GQ48_TANCI|nr:retrovirus-related Pol polyprotein from transposon TNT 1-94 [Tanacetum cinerariifolium]